MLSAECQDGGHLGYRNRTILEILILYVTPYASHQVSAQSDMVWEKSFEEFQEAAMAAILDIRTEQF